MAANVLRLLQLDGVHGASETRRDWIDLDSFSLDCGPIGKHGHGSGAAEPVKVDCISHHSSHSAYLYQAIASGGEIPKGMLAILEDKTVRFEYEMEKIIIVSYQMGGMGQESFQLECVRGKLHVGSIADLESLAGAEAHRRELNELKHRSKH